VMNREDEKGRHEHPGGKARPITGR
jgi:hypothetical protein